MDFKKSENENGLSLEVSYSKEYEKNYYTIPGGDNSNPTWEEYLEGYKEEWQEHIKLLKKFVEENGLIGITGQNQDNWIFKFSDGNSFGFSWRGWGDFMQAMVNKKEGYMAYYM